jgi:hypothetical protein
MKVHPLSFGMLSRAFRSPRLAAAAAAAAAPPRRFLNLHECNALSLILRAMYHSFVPGTKVQRLWLPSRSASLAEGLLQ